MNKIRKECSTRVVTPASSGGLSCRYEFSAQARKIINLWGIPRLNRGMTNGKSWATVSLILPIIFCSLLFAANLAPVSVKAISTNPQGYAESTAAMAGPTSGAMPAPIATPSAPAAPAPAADTGLAKPNVIPCLPGSLLPCITDKTQKIGGSEIRKYVLETWGSGFISGFLGLAAIGSVIFIIVGGVQMLLAVGNEEALGKAKKTILWAILGLVISILSVAIVSIISNLPF